MNEGKNRRVYTLGIIGGIIFAVSIIIFIILKPEQCNVSVFLGFLFLLIAETVLFGGLIAIEFFEDTSQIIVRSGCGFCIIGYAIVSSILSIIYMFLNTSVVRVFLVLQVILSAVCIVLFLAFKSISRKAWEMDERTRDSVLNVDNMAEEILSLQKNPKYGKQLCELAQELKYADNSTDLEVDCEIKQTISKMKQELMADPYSERVADYISAISILIRKRKNQMRNKKIGGI